MLKEKLIESIRNKKVTKEKRDNVLSYLNSSMEYDSRMIKQMLSDLFDNYKTDNIEEKHFQGIIDILDDGDTITNPVKISIKNISPLPPENKKVENFSEEYYTNHSTFESNTLRYENKKLLEELTKTKNELNKYKKMVSLTEQESLNIISDEDINELYLEYKNNGTKEFKSAFIVECDSKLIMVKQYYVIVRRNLF